MYLCAVAWRSRSYAVRKEELPLSGNALASSRLIRVLLLVGSRFFDWKERAVHVIRAVAGVLAAAGAIAWVVEHQAAVPGAPGGVGELRAYLAGPFFSGDAAVGVLLAQLGRPVVDELSPLPAIAGTDDLHLRWHSYLR